MPRNFASLKTLSLRSAALAGVVALTAAAAAVGATAPAAAMHGAIFMHHGMGGMHHHGFAGFHHGFHHRFAFGGFGYSPIYAYNDYSDYDDCYRRVWGSHGWRLIDVCQ
jgi:hypothetical protein